MNVLLIEPLYKNKYPPICLMKLSTYHKMRGDQVTFYKGAIKDLVLDILTKNVIQNWIHHLPDQPKGAIPVEQIRRFIQTGRTASLELIRSTDAVDFSLTAASPGDESEDRETGDR
jgi:hypothetical protein